MDKENRAGLLSVVLPSYNEEASVPRAARTISELLAQAGVQHEIIFVDDGSRDGTWAAIQGQASLHPQVRGSASPGISGRRRPFSPVWPRRGGTARR